jgi:hypothetical protein
LPFSGQTVPLNHRDQGGAMELTIEKPKEEKVDFAVLYGGKVT